MSDSNYDAGYAEGKRYMAATVADRLGEIVAEAGDLTKYQILERIERLRQDMRKAR